MTIVAIVMKPSSVYRNKTEEQNPMEGKIVQFVENDYEKVNADGMRGHLEAVGKSHYRPGIYEKYVKRVIDIILSLLGLVFLSPVFVILSLWIVIDDPDPVVFTQKRIGRNKQYFYVNKISTMKNGLKVA